MDAAPLVILIRSNYSRFGGAETITLNLIHALLEQTDAKIHLLTLPDQKWPVQHCRLKIIPIGIARGHRLWVVWAFNRMAVQYLRAHPASAILSIDRIERFTHLHAGGGSHRKFLQVRSRHSNWPQRNFRKLSFYHWFILYIERRGFTNPDLKKIHCCSEMVAQELRDLYALPNDKLYVCYNPIDWKGIGQHFNERDNLAGQLSEMHQVDRSVQWLLFLGSGFERKGLDIAVQGLRYMPDDYHLMVVGSGKTDSYERLARRYGVAGRIRFIGPQPQGWRFAAMCKALVLPSRYEPFGMAIAEAQAMGLPVLVSNQTGYSEIVEPGKSGIILDLSTALPDIPDAFDRLNRLIKSPYYNPEEIRKAVQHLDNSTIMQKLIENFLELPSRIQLARA